MHISDRIYLNLRINEILFGKISLTPVEKSIKRQFNKNKKLRKKINKYFSGR